MIQTETQQESMDLVARLMKLDYSSFGDGEVKIMSNNNITLVKVGNKDVSNEAYAMLE